MRITRDNIDAILDSGALKIRADDALWWTVKRNGRTWHGKRDRTRLRIPIRVGLVAMQITETDFVQEVLNPETFCADE